jgi:formylmethanofuran dehydrogenase subunit E
MTDTAWLEARRQRLETDVVKAREEYRKAEEFILRAEGAILLINEQLAEMDKTDQPSPVQVSAPPATTSADVVPCDYCGAAITGRKFRKGEKVYCGIACADKDANGQGG